MLREDYPAALVAFGTHLEHNDALSVLAIAPTASLGRQAPVSKIASALRRVGRQRGVEKRSQQSTPRCCGVSISRHRSCCRAYGMVTSSTVALIGAYNTEIAALEAELAEHFDEHPDAKIIRSLPDSDDPRRPGAG